MWRTALVAFGGVIGAVARYWLAGLVHNATDSSFPLGTLSVNLIGSFVLGVVMALSLERGLVGADLRMLLAVGVCGGFTTMSTFSYETLALLRDGESLLALTNVGTTVLGCLGAVWLGDLAGRIL